MGFRYGVVLLILFPFLFLSCATPDREAFEQEIVDDTEEFEEVVKIEKIEEEPAPPKKEAGKVTKPKSTKKSVGQTKKIEKKPVKKTVKKTKEVIKEPVKKKTKQGEKKPIVKKTKGPRQPKIEDAEGFDGRRPIVQPYNIGEEIVLGISYFGVEAGKFTMKVMPMVQVNGQKSYHFRYIIKSSPLFNMFYKVDDVAETFVDYNSLLPHSYEIHVDESKQVRETRTFFDHKKKKAVMWDSKKRPGKKLEKRKVKWDLNPFSQNVFSAAYYLRNFTLKVGKQLKVRVGHEGKNIEMTAKVIRRETIYTDAGKFDTFVVKPKFDIDGKFKPTGENYLWLTADDKKFIVRLESKIKIGSIVGEVQSIKK